MPRHTVTLPVAALNSGRETEFEDDGFLFSETNAPSEMPPLSTLPGVVPAEIPPSQAQVPLQVQEHMDETAMAHVPSWFDIE